MANWLDLVAACTGGQDGALIRANLTVTDSRDVLLVWPAAQALVDTKDRPFDLAQVPDGSSGDAWCSVKLWRDGAELRTLRWEGRTDGTFSISAVAGLMAGLAGDRRTWERGSTYSITAQMQVPGGQRCQLISGRMRVVQQEGEV